MTWWWDLARVTAALVGAVVASAVVLAVALVVLAASAAWLLALEGLEWCWQRVRR